MHYQVGGSLTTDAPSYVERQADKLFSAALERGEFCYVLNSRQMGKSSLMVRAHQQFSQRGYRCAVLDMTNIGSENITPLQWYKGIVKDLWRSLKLTRQADFAFNAWWKDEEDISLLQRLSQFIKDVLLSQFPDDEIVIFVDEIDSILSLPFSVDDFFALVRFCYNQRAIDPEYKRIHFAIFGVATPADLIRARARTPFNIGTPIYLNGFTHFEAQSLASGLTIQKGDPGAVLKAILSWTDGQPFLTQKLCQLAISSSQVAASQPLMIPPGNEDYWVDSLVQSRIIDRWESQDEPEHLRTIRNRILSNPDTAGRLLAIYQQVLLGEVAADDSRDQIELILSGLVHRSEGSLRVKNRIYAEIFNASWVKQQLDNLRPYAQQLDAWAASRQTDESRLLRGQALKDAQTWSQGKRLSDLDYQYLAASVESDRKAIQQGLEAQRVEAVEAQLAEEQARLIQEKKTLKFQRLLSAAIGGALLVTAGLGLTALRQSRNAKIHEVEALVAAADGSFDSHRQLDAIVQALRAHKNLAGLTHLDPELSQAVKATLQRVMLGANELNRLTFSAEVNDGVFSPDGQLMAIATAEGILSLRKNSGEVIWEIPAHEASIGAVAFSPDGQTIATGATDKTVKLWTLDGELISTPVSQFDSVRELSFFPDGKSFVAAGRGLTGRWGIDGEQIMFTERGSLQAIATDGSMLVFHLRPQDLQDSVSNRPPPPRRLNRLDNRLDNRQASEANARFDARSDARATVTAENTQPSQQGEVFRSETSSRGHLINTLVTNAQGDHMTEFVGETGPTFSTAISADNKLIATSGRDGAVHIWEPDGTFVQVLVGNRSDVREMAFSPDGELLATAGDDNVIRLWQVKGGLIKTFEGHQVKVNKLIFSPDGQQLMSTSEDQTLRLWQVKRTQYQSLAGHGDTIYHLAFNNDGQLFSYATDLWLNVWQQQGDSTQAVPTQQIRPKEHPHISGMATVNQEIALALPDGDIKIWQADNWVSPDRLPADYPASQILDVGESTAGLAYSPDGQQLVVISNSTIKLLQRDSGGQFSEEPTALVESIPQPEAIAFSPDDTPDGTLIAVGSGEGTLTLLDAEGNFLKTIEGHGAAIVDTVFSLDGQWLAAASKDRRLELWSVSDLLSESFDAKSFDAKSFNPRADSRFATEQTQISQITFTPDSQLLVSALADGTLSIWDLSSQERLRTLWGHDSALNAVAVSPDGRLIASGGRDRKIILWNLPAILAQDEVTAACEWVRNYLKHGSQAADYPALCSKSTHSP
ncbi:MAG: AAA-like domain-containing protein [Cyanobacteria bacterium J06560_6]